MKLVYNIGMTSSEEIPDKKKIKPVKVETVEAEVVDAEIVSPDDPALEPNAPFADPPKVEPNFDEGPDVDVKMTHAQQKMIWGEYLGDSDAVHADLKKYFGIESMKLLTKDQASTWIDKLESGEISPDFETASTESDEQKPGYTETPQKRNRPTKEEIDKEKAVLVGDVTQKLSKAGQLDMLVGIKEAHGVSTMQELKLTELRKIHKEIMEMGD